MHLGGHKVLDVRFDPDALVIDVEYRVQPGAEVRRVFRMFDSDHSDYLDDGEVSQLQAYLERLALKTLKVHRAGALLRFDVTSREVSGARGKLHPKHAIRLVLSLRATHAAYPQGEPVTFSFEDRHREKHVTIPVRLGFAEGLAQVDGQGNVLPPPKPVAVGGTLPQLGVGRRLAVHIRRSDIRRSDVRRGDVGHGDVVHGSGQRAPAK